jgi:UDP-N-acetylmuramoylalanine--D-glutamate ligase
VTATDDQLAPAAAERARVLADVGVTTVARPDDAELRALVAAADVVVPSPGVPYAHPALAGARSRGTRVWSEFELAARWAPDLPLVAVTGTNGKTTVTTLVAAMLQADGVRTAAVGNTDVPLLDVLDGTLDVAVVEASSFRLEFTETFAPAVALWLNFAPDHLDWHPSLEHYRAAKAKVWSAQGPDDRRPRRGRRPGRGRRRPRRPCGPGWRRRVLVSGTGAGEGDYLVGPPGLLRPGRAGEALAAHVTNAARCGCCGVGGRRGRGRGCGRCAGLSGGSPDRL